MSEVYLSALVGLTLSASAAQTDEFLEIKGFHVGMKSWEFKAHQTDFCYMEGCLLTNKIPFTVGGVKGRFLAVSYNDSAEVTMADLTFDSLTVRTSPNCPRRQVPTGKMCGVRSYNSNRYTSSAGRL